MMSTCYNCLMEMITHNKCFIVEMWKIIPILSHFLILMLRCNVFQLLDLDTDLRQEKVRAAWKLFKGKSTNNIDQLDSGESTTKGGHQAQLSVPLVESLFLPDFPVRGDIEHQGFEVFLKIVESCLLKVQVTRIFVFDTLRVVGLYTN